MADGSTVRVVYLGDADHLNKATKRAVADLDRVDKKASGVGSKLAKVGKAAAFGVGAVAAGAVVAAPAVFKMAAQMQLLDAKAKVVFGDTLPMVDKWAKANANAMGLTKKEATGLAAGFADLLIPMGFTRKQAAAMSTDVVGLSGALAQWSGGKRTAAEVSEILAKAMLGERDGLKELGISISEADVQGRLLKNGQDKLTGAALEQAKAMATQQLIMEKSTDAQKAYADGADTLASKQAKATAKIKELRDKAVEALIPVLEKATEWGGKLAEEFEAGTGTGGKLKDALSDIRDIGEKLWPVVEKVAKFTGQFIGFLAAHPDLVAHVAVGVAAYAVAMKAAAVWTGAMAAIKLGATALGIGAVGAASAAAAPGVAALSGAILGPAGLVAALTALALAPSMWAASRVTDGGGSAEFAPYDPRATGGTGRPGYKPPIPKGLTPNGGRTDGPKRKPGEGNMPSWRPSGPPQDDVNGRPRGGRLAMGGQTINLVVDGKTLATVVNRQNGKGDRNGGF